MLPAVTDASNMAIFDALINSASPVKARLVMKIDIVKPMPPSIPAPNTCFRFMPNGSRQIPSNTAIKTSSVIPKGLPMTKPVTIPMLFALLRSCAQLEPITIPVFAKAKIGNTKKAIGL